MPAIPISPPGLREQQSPDPAPPCPSCGCPLGKGGWKELLGSLPSSPRCDKPAGTAGARWLHGSTCALPPQLSCVRAKTKSNPQQKKETPPGSSAFSYPKAGCCSSFRSITIFAYFPKIPPSKASKLHANSSFIY